MKNANQTTERIGIENLEYLGTVRHGGREYIALLSLEDGSGKTCFFSCEPDGSYRRVADPETVEAVRVKFRPEALYGSSGWAGPALNVG